MSHNSNQNEQLPKVFSRLGKVTPPRPPNYNNFRYYNGPQSNDGIRIARTTHLPTQPYHYNPNMVPSHTTFQPHPMSFYPGSFRPQQEQIHQQNSYFSNNNSATMNTNGRMSANFRPDASSSTLIPSSPSSSIGSTNGFSFVKNAHKDPAASDMIISFVRNDNPGTYAYHNKNDQNQDQATRHSPPSSTIPSPSISADSDHVAVDYHSSSRRTYDNDRDELDHQAAPNHRDIIAKSIKITASRPLSSDKNTISSSSAPHHHRDNNVATTTITNNDLHDKQQQTHHSDHHEMRTVAMNRKVIVEKRDRSCDNTISSSKRSKRSSRSISPSPVRDKRSRSLSRESDDHSHKKHSRIVSNSEDDDDDSTRRKRRPPSPISPPRHSRNYSHSSPFSGRTRSLSPGSSSDEDKAPFLRHEADRYVPDYNRRPLPPQYRRSRVSNNRNTVASPVKSSKSAAALVKPSPTSKPAPAATKPTSAVVKTSSAAVKPSSAAVKPSSAAVKPSSAAVKPSSAAIKPSPVAVKSAPATTVEKPTPVVPLAVKPTPVTKPTQVTANPTTGAITSTASSLTTKSVPIVTAASSPTTEKHTDLGSSPLSSTSNTSPAPKPFATTGKQLRNFPPLGSTSTATKSVHTTKELRNFPPLGSSASRSTRSPPIAAPALRDLRSYLPLGHHPSHDLRSYPPPSSNAPSIATIPNTPYPHSPPASSVSSSSNRSYNRVWMKPTNDVGANSQQDGSNVVVPKQVLPPPLAAVTRSPPSASIANQQAKMIRNNDSVMAIVKQEPVSEAPKKPVSASQSAQVPLSNPAIISTDLLNDPVSSSNSTTTSSSAPQSDSTHALPPPSPSASTNEIQNKVQTNDATTTPSPSADPTTITTSTIVQLPPSVTTQKTDVDVSTCASTEATQTQTPRSLKTARRKLARRRAKIRQWEQIRLLAIEERDDVVVDVLPASQQPPAEEQGQGQGQDDSISNANIVKMSQTQTQPPPSSEQNMNVSSSAKSHENVTMIANNSSGINIVSHPTVQSQSLSKNENMLEQNHQQETVDRSVPTTPLVPKGPAPARSSRRRLPPPWKVKMSDSMEIYYHNPITGEDTSIRPE